MHVYISARDSDACVRTEHCNQNTHITQDLLVFINNNNLLVPLLLVLTVHMCRSRAEEVKNTANDTKQALDLSEEAIEKARAALKEAHNNLNDTRNSTTEVQPAWSVSVDTDLLMCLIAGFLKYFLFLTSRWIRG